MKLSVCIDSVFSGIDPVEAMEISASCGYRAVEFWGWMDKDIGAIDRARQKLDLTVAAFCTSRFELTDPARREEYVAGVAESIPVARRLGCGRLISQVGPDTGAPRKAQHESIVAGLRACAPMLESAGLTLVIEPLNTRVDHKGYYLWSSQEGADIVAEVGSPNVRLLFDLYHQQIMEGDIIRRSTSMIGLIGHMHAAGNPGRHELDQGELDYRQIFAALGRAGYDGYVGLEYFPLRNLTEGLKKWAGWAPDRG